MNQSIIQLFVTEMKFYGNIVTPFIYSLPLSDSGQLKHYGRQCPVLAIEGLAL